MRLLRRLLRDARALSAVLLLATLVAGEMADARHHLSDPGCAADAGGRPDNCTCASLHVMSLTGDAPLALVPVELDREFVPLAATLAPRARALASATPRAPPRG